MISLLVISFAAVWISGAILSVLHVRRAPVAVEDESGFRVLEQPCTEPARALAVVRAN